MAGADQPGSGCVNVYPIIPLIIPAIHFGWDWIITIAQWLSIEAML